MSSGESIVELFWHVREHVLPKIALHTTAGSTTLQTDAGLLLYAIYKNYVEKMFKICII